MSEETAAEAKAAGERWWRARQRLRQARSDWAARARARRASAEGKESAEGKGK